MTARAVKINVLGVEHFRVALRLLMCGDKVTKKKNGWCAKFSCYRVFSRKLDKIISMEMHGT